MAESLYRAVGGAEGCRNLATAFYARVARDPVLRPLFPGKTMTCAIEEFSAFMVQFLGGPADKAQRRWWLSLRESHARFRIGDEHRSAWMSNMIEALNDVRMEEPARTELRHFFEESSAYIVKRDQAQSDGMGKELSHRWKIQRGLDDAVAAIRQGETEAFGAIAESLIPSVRAGVVAMMIGSRHDEQLQGVREQLIREPSLVHEHYAGRTLLHAAAAAGDSATVKLLLQLGADPNAQDGGSHTPLYSLGNECTAPGGGDLVRILVKAGARVDACAGVKHCTPLHMAARRGNVEIARALLECGANPEARDTKGETPLKRALNCRKASVAALLATAGASRAAE